MRFGDFCNVKDQYDFISTLAFLASRRACRPAVFPSQLTRSCTTPASREARRRAAVTPQPSRMSPYAPVRLRRAVRKGLSPRAAVTPQSICFPSSTPAPYGARCGVQGGERKRVPSGHNRRRRLATGSRQPKRGFGTAVPKTTIEVADHCPCLSGRWLRGRIRRTRGSSRCRRR